MWVRTHCVKSKCRANALENFWAKNRCVSNSKMLGDLLGHLQNPSLSVAFMYAQNAASALRTSLRATCSRLWAELADCRLRLTLSSLSPSLACMPGQCSQRATDRFMCPSHFPSEAGNRPSCLKRLQSHHNTVNMDEGALNADDSCQGHRVGKRIPRALP